MFAAGAFLACQFANAALVVDTGPGPVDPSSIPTSNWSLYEKQWLSERFELSAATRVSAVSGWIAAYGSSGTAHVSIFEDSGEDGPGGLLYSAQFEAGANTVGFAGVSNVAWQLAAGTYFVAFQVLPGDTLFGSMPSPASEPLSLGSYGYYIDDRFEPKWYHSIDTDMGIRIEGIAAVPEPSQVALMLGAGAIFGIRTVRRRKQQAA
jgi:hypothetical protein